MKINPHVFRAYDVRGLVNEDLTDEFVYELGRGFASYAKRAEVGRLALGRDCRLSSPSFRDAMARGISECGVEVLDLGVVPTPLLYFALFNLPVDGGVMITGSHNPPEYNGFKLCVGKAAIYGEQLQDVRRVLERAHYSYSLRPIANADVVTPYREFMRGNIKMSGRKLKVVVDAGNGTGGMVGVPILRDMGVEVIDLFCQPDGNFPNHHPDPTVPEYMQACIDKVKSTGADCGIAYDGDADRIGVIDERGQIIWGDRLMLFFAREILKENPGAVFVSEVKCSKVLGDEITRLGGRMVMWKTGHSLIKAKMQEESAELAGEMSGHIFFKNRYFGFDDAIYSSLRLVEILTQADQPLSA